MEVLILNAIIALFSISDKTVGELRARLIVTTIVYSLMVYFNVFERLF